MTKEFNNNNTENNEDLPVKGEGRAKKFRAAKKHLNKKQLREYLEDMEYN